MRFGLLAIPTLLVASLSVLPACGSGGDAQQTYPGQAGTGGSGGSGTGGSGGSGGTSGTSPDSELGTGTMSGSGSSAERYHTAQVSRDGVPYLFITNGWGPGFVSHNISWEGTSFVVESMTGDPGTAGQPASYPSLFCGKYSIMEVPNCGLPAAIDALSSLRTGWRWAANGNMGIYNAAYDIWLGDGTKLQGYLMVWLRDPPGAQPAGTYNGQYSSIAVANVPGVWNVWNGTVNGLPIVNYVRAENSDSSEIEFDVMDVLRDAEARGLSVPGTHVNAVAVGFEIWKGPVTDLTTEDFYVKVE